MSKQTDLINIPDAITVSGSNVGIGTSSPSRQLEIYDDGTVGQAVLALTAQNTEPSRIMFADPDDVNIGILDYHHSDNSMRFIVNNAERMRIDSSGNVLVGGTNTTPWSLSSGSGNAVIRPEGYAGFAATSAAIELNRIGSDGNIANFRKNGTTVGSIFSGHGGTQVGIGTNTTGITFNPATRSMMPANPSSTSPQLDATLDIGFPSVRWKDAYLSGGVYLGGTGSANKLDDYEEGTHQTVATMTTSGTVTLNTSFDRISYTKVGRLVTIIGNPRILTVSSPVGQLKFTLPFTAKSGQTDECRAGFIVYYYDNTAGSGSYTKQVNATVNEGTNVVKLDLTNSHNNNIAADSSDEVLFSFSYMTA